MSDLVIPSRRLGWPGPGIPEATIHSFFKAARLLLHLCHSALLRPHNSPVSFVMTSQKLAIGKCRLLLDSLWASAWAANRGTPVTAFQVVIHSFTNSAPALPLFGPPSSTRRAFPLATLLELELPL